MKRAVVLLLIAMLCGCVTPPKSQFAMLIDKWVGRSADELAVQSGPPEEVLMLDSGGKIYSYLKSQMAERNSETKADITNRDRIYSQDVDREALRIGDPWSVVPEYPTLAPDFYGLRPKPTQRKNACKLLFKVSATNIIESWSAEGAGCE